MSNIPNNQKTNAIKTIYAENNDVARMLDHMATGTNHRKSTPVEDVIQHLGVSRVKAIHILQLLSNTGCGTFRKGRTTKNVQNPARIEWTEHYARIGKVARGEIADLRTIPHIESVEETLGSVALPQLELPQPTPLTIKEAKRLLAESLGVEETNIEIIVKG